MPSTPDNSMVVFPCLACGKSIKIGIERAGQPVVCVHCHAVVNSPHMTQAAQMPAAAVTSPVAAATAASAPNANAERTLLIVHPSMFGRRPLGVVGAAFIAVLGVALSVYLMVQTIGGSTTGLFAGMSPWLSLSGLGLTLVMMVMLGYWRLQSMQEELVITTRTATMRRGLLSRTTSQTQLRNIQDIQVDQSLAQRLLGVGTVTISNAGQEDDELVIHSIANPQRVRDVINEHRGA